MSDLDAAIERRQVEHLRLIDAAPLRPGVEAMIERAERAGVRLALASSSPYSWVERHLRRRGLHDAFEAFANGDMVERAKPWPDIFLLAAAKLGVEPSACLAIEDSHNGLRAALAADVRCIVAPNPMTVGSDFTGAAGVFDSLADVPWNRYGL